MRKFTLEVGSLQPPHFQVTRNTFQINLILKDQQSKHRLYFHVSRIILSANKVRHSFQTNLFKYRIVIFHRYLRRYISLKNFSVEINMHPHSNIVIGIGNI